MRGKHGRYRPGQPDEAATPTADVITEPGPEASPAHPQPPRPPQERRRRAGYRPLRGAIFVPGGTTFHPPAARLAPTPPSLAADSHRHRCPSTWRPPQTLLPPISRHRLADDDVQLSSHGGPRRAVPVEAPSVEALPMPSPAAVACRSSQPSRSQASRSLPRESSLTCSPQQRPFDWLRTCRHRRSAVPRADSSAPVPSAGDSAPVTRQRRATPPATLPSPAPAQPAAVAPWPGSTESRHGGDQILPVSDPALGVGAAMTHRAVARAGCSPASACC